MQKINLYKAYYLCGCTREFLDEYAVDDECWCSGVPSQLSRVVEISGEREVINGGIVYPETQPVVEALDE